MLQLDKNQVAILDETAQVHIITTSSITESIQPVSLATTTTMMNPLNPQLNPFNVQCTLQMKSSHSAGCLNYGVTCSACGIVGQKLEFCRKRIALPKSRHRFHLVLIDNLNTLATRNCERNKKSLPHHLKMILRMDCYYLKGTPLI